MHNSWPTPAYPPTPTDLRRARAEARRNRLGKVGLALLLAALLYPFVH
ncbi:MAG: hypothetical protein ACRYFX_18575 [Janthinobacterium lividum]